MKRKNWIKMFLSITGLAIILELIASFDKNPETESWTLLITRNIPEYIGYPIIIIFAGWLLYHFKKYYKEQRK